MWLIHQPTDFLEKHQNKFVNKFTFGTRDGNRWKRFRFSYPFTALQTNKQQKNRYFIDLFR